MRIWLALVVAPILALTDLTVAFATVSPACAHQLPLALHFVHGGFFVATLICTLAAWTAWRASATAPANGETPAQARFLAGIATAAAALSTVAVMSMWSPVLVIPACIS